MENLEYGPLKADQIDDLASLLSQCFLSSPEYLKKSIGATGPHHYRVLLKRGKVIGGLGTIATGQWFQGRRIPMAGIKAVGMAPHERGQGQALFLLKKALEEFRDEEIPLSTLFPSTRALYRKAGFELAGDRYTYHLKIPRLSWLSSCHFSPLDSNRHSAIYSLYRKWAPLHNGPIDRVPYMWEKLLRPENFQVFTYLIEGENGPQGYIAYRQEKEQRELLLLDSPFLNVEAARSALVFLCRHHPLIQKITWPGGPRDSRLFLLPEITPQIEENWIWMSRIVSVKKALSLRPYPLYLKGEIHLEVEDEILPSNQGRWILTLEEGRGRVKRGGEGRIYLSIRALASLFTGYLGAEELQRRGLLSGDSDDLSLLSTAFAASPPWMADSF